jgi:ribose transport system substrate-binding protein
MLKKLKRVTSIILCASMVMSFALTGCSNNSNTSKTTSGTSTSGNSNFTGDSSKEFYMVTFLSGFSYWKDCYKGFEAAGKLYGVKTVYGGTTEYDVNSAVTAFDQIIAKHPAGIAVSCMDAKAYQSSINKAIAAGIPVVTFDSDSADSDRLAFIGTQNYQAGATAARYIGKKLGGKGVVAAGTTLGQTNIKERTQGFEETMKSEYPNIKVAQIVDTGTDQVTAATAISNLLKKNSDVDYIFCAFQSAMLGAQKALQETNMTGKVKIVGFDTDSTTLDSIKSGDVDASISQGPWCEGFWSMNYLFFVSNNLMNPTDDWQAKKYPTLPVTADSGSTVVTKDNVDSFYQK